MKKKLLSIVLGLIFTVSIYAGVVSAQVVESTANLNRDGGSWIFVNAVKESGTYAVLPNGTKVGQWCSNLKSVSCTGIPSGIINSNIIYSRLRANNPLLTEATPLIAHSYWNYQNDGSNKVWGDYYTGHGANGLQYRMATSMGGSSPNSSCSVSYRWNP